MRKKNIAALLSCAILIWFQPHVVQACSWEGGPTNLKESVEQSDAVFTGKVLEIDEKKKETKFEVYRFWKGILTKKVSLFSYTGNCNYKFKQGEEYLVFASSGTKYLSAYIFFPNAKLADAKDTIEKLGEGTEAKEPEADQPKEK